MRIYEDSLKIKQFLMTSYPLKMTSYHSQILLIARFWVDLFEKTVVVGIQPTSCLLNFHTCTLLFDFKLEKPLQSKRKSINQTLFSTKSTTLNPMVKSDLVTYRGVTMPNLFLQATNTFILHPSYGMDLTGMNHTGIYRDDHENDFIEKGIKF